MKSPVKETNCKSESECILKALRNVPSLGKKKCQLLLDKYKNIGSMINADYSDLVKVLGSKSADEFQKFMNYSSL